MPLLTVRSALTFSGLMEKLENGALAKYIIIFLKYITNYQKEFVAQ